LTTYFCICDKKWVFYNCFSFGPKLQVWTTIKTLPMPATTAKPVQNVFFFVPEWPQSYSVAAGLLIFAFVTKNEYFITVLVLVQNYKFKSTIKTLPMPATTAKPVQNVILFVPEWPQLNSNANWPLIFAFVTKNEYFITVLVLVQNYKFKSTIKTLPMPATTAKPVQNVILFVPEWPQFYSVAAGLLIFAFVTKNEYFITVLVLVQHYKFKLL
jgi:hypothetical protein